MLLCCNLQVFEAIESHVDCVCVCVCVLNRHNVRTLLWIECFDRCQLLMTWTLQWRHFTTIVLTHSVSNRTQLIALPLWPMHSAYWFMNAFVFVCMHFTNENLIDFNLFSITSLCDQHSTVAHHGHACLDIGNVIRAIESNRSVCGGRYWLIWMSLNNSCSLCA